MTVCCDFETGSASDADCHVNGATTKSFDNGVAKVSRFWGVPSCTAVFDVDLKFFVGHIIFRDLKVKFISEEEEVLSDPLASAQLI